MTILRWRDLSRDAQALTALFGLIALAVSIAMVASGYRGLPERVEAVERRQSISEQQYSDLSRKMDRVICLLETEGGGPLRCER